MSFFASVLVILFVIIICSVCTGSSAKSNNNNNKGGYTQSTGNINVIDTNFKVRKIECPKCLRMVPASSKFCPGCGYKLEKIVKCPNCGSPVISGYSYCANCGCRLSH